MLSLLPNILLAVSPIFTYSAQLIRVKSVHQPRIISCILIISAIMRMTYILFHHRNYALLINNFFLLLISYRLFMRKKSLSIFEERVFFLTEHNFSKTASKVFFSIFGCALTASLIFTPHLFIAFCGCGSGLLEILSVLLHLVIVRMESRQSLNFFKESRFLSKVTYRLSAFGEAMKFLWLLYCDVPYSLLFSCILLFGLELYISI